jgi:hypoxanthine-guanine phosphoribosyltransferase
MARLFFVADLLRASRNARASLHAQRQQLPRRHLQQRRGAHELARWRRSCDQDVLLLDDILDTGLTLSVI